MVSQRHSFDPSTRGGMPLDIPPITLIRMTCYYRGWAAVYIPWGRVAKASPCGAFEVPVAGRDLLWKLLFGRNIPNLPFLAPQLRRIVSRYPWQHREARNWSRFKSAWGRQRDLSFERPTFRPPCTNHIVTTHPTPPNQLWLEQEGKRSSLT